MWRFPPSTTRKGRKHDGVQSEAGDAEEIPSSNVPSGNVSRRPTNAAHYTAFQCLTQVVCMARGARQIIGSPEEENKRQGRNEQESETGAGRRIGSGWAAQADAAFLDVRGGRELHRRAGLAEIERELDRRLEQMRAGMRADLAQASAAADLERAGERAACLDCGVALRDEAVTLLRDYGTCPRCGRTNTFRVSRALDSKIKGTDIIHMTEQRAGAAKG